MMFIVNTRGINSSVRFSSVQFGSCIFANQTGYFGLDTLLTKQNQTKYRKIGSIFFGTNELEGSIYMPTQ